MAKAFKAAIVRKVADAICQDVLFDVPNAQNVLPRRENGLNRGHQSQLAIRDEYDIVTRLINAPLRSFQSLCVISGRLVVQEAVESRICLVCRCYTDDIK